MSEPRSGARNFASKVLAVVVGFTALVGGCVWLATQQERSKPLPHPPPPAKFGTASEIGTRGDSPDPDALFHGDFPSDSQTQERRVGGAPARFSGYTTWVRSVSRVTARKYVDGYAGSYLRVRATVFNRDIQSQSVCACDFYVWTRAAGRRAADFVRVPTLSGIATMRSGTTRDGDVYLYVGTVPGPYYVIYDPDYQSSFSSSTARGVWRARV
jgi:hypothetical protein